MIRPDRPDLAPEGGDHRRLGPVVAAVDRRVQAEAEADQVDQRQARAAPPGRRRRRSAPRRIAPSEPGQRQPLGRGQSRGSAGRSRASRGPAARPGRGSPRGRPPGSPRRPRRSAPGPSPGSSGASRPTPPAAASERRPRPRPRPGPSAASPRPPDRRQPIQADPAQRHQAEGDPERQPAVVGHVQDRARPGAGCRPAGAGTPRGTRTPSRPTRNRTRGWTRRADHARGASQIRVASPANPPADSFRLWTPSAFARLGWPRRWLP